MITSSEAGISNLINKHFAERFYPLTMHKRVQFCMWLSSEDACVFSHFRGVTLIIKYGST